MSALRPGYRTRGRAPERWREGSLAHHSTCRGGHREVRPGASVRPPAAEIHGELPGRRHDGERHVQSADLAADVDGLEAHGERPLRVDAPLGERGPRGRHGVRTAEELEESGFDREEHVRCELEPDGEGGVADAGEGAGCRLDAEVLDRESDVREEDLFQLDGGQFGEPADEGLLDQRLARQERFTEREGRLTEEDEAEQLALGDLGAVRGAEGEGGFADGAADAGHDLDLSAVEGDNAAYGGDRDGRVRRGFAEEAHFGCHDVEPADDRSRLERVRPAAPFQGAEDPELAPLARDHQLALELRTEVLAGDPEVVAGFETEFIQGDRGVPWARGCG